MLTCIMDWQQPMFPNWKVWFLLSSHEHKNNSVPESENQRYAVVCEDWF